MAAPTSASPLRILFVENGIGYGGAVTCLRHLIRALDRSKFEPIVVTGQSAGPYADMAEDAQWLVIRDRRVDVTELRRRLARARWPDRIPGARLVLLQMIARLDDLANFMPLFLQLAWTLARLRPAIVHVNNEPLCNRAAIVAAKVLHVPVVCHVRGDQSGSRSMAHLFRLPDHFIAVSRWISASVARVGIPPNRCTLIYDGVDFDRLNPRADGVSLFAQCMASRKTPSPWACRAF